MLVTNRSLCFSIVNSIEDNFLSRKLKDTDPQSCTNCTTMEREDLGCLIVNTTGSQLLRINRSVSLSAQPEGIKFISGELAGMLQMADDAVAQCLECQTWDRKWQIALGGNL